MVRTKGDGEGFVPGSPGRGPRSTRYNLTGTRPPNLLRVVEALLKGQPRHGYPDKNAVMGVLSGCGYKVKGERDDLYRFLLNHGVVLCPDEFGMSVHVCGPEDAELLCDAYDKKREQSPVTAAHCQANYLVALYGLGYRLVSSAGEQVVPLQTLIQEREQEVAPLVQPHDLYDLLNIGELRDHPAMIRALSDVELDGIMDGIHRLEPEQTKIIELIVQDKARRLDEAEQHRQRERKRQELDQQMEAAATELARVEAEAKAARLEADKAAHARRQAEQRLKELERARARL